MDPGNQPLDITHMLAARSQRGRGGRREVAYRLSDAVGLQLPRGGLPRGAPGGRPGPGRALHYWYHNYCHGYYCLLVVANISCIIVAIIWYSSRNN